MQVIFCTNKTSKPSFVAYVLHSYETSYLYPIIKNTFGVYRLYHKKIQSEKNDYGILTRFMRIISGEDISIFIFL